MTLLKNKDDIWRWYVIFAVNFQFEQLEWRSLKKIRASTGFEPVTSAIPVRCSTNWAMKPHIGSEVNCEFLFSRERSEMTCSIWNDSYMNCGYIWRWYVIFAVNFQFKQLEWRSLKKKTLLQRDSNPWPPRYRCDALPTELWSHTLGARSIVSSYFPVKGVKWRVVYEMIHIWTADIYEGDMWSSQWISNLSNWNEEAWKKSGLQRDSNPWPPRYRCDALPTELWSHTLGARTIVSSYFPVKGVKWRVVYEMIHIWTADIYEGDMWSSQWISNLSLRKTP